MGLYGNIKKIRGFKTEIFSLGRAYLDRRTPMKTKLTIAILGLAYIISPIDIAPDILPLLGLTDDIIVLPLMMWILLPQNVLEDARKYEENKKIKNSKKKHWFLWIFLIVLLTIAVYFLFKYLGFDLGSEPSIIAENF